MKIIVRSPNWVGDCVMSIGSLKTLKYENPESKIYLVTKPRLDNIYRDMKEIEKIIILPQKITIKNFFAVIKSMGIHKIRNGILLTNSFSSALLFRLAGIKYLTGYMKDLRSFMLAKKKKLPKRISHQQDLYVDLIHFFNGYKSEKRFSNSIFLSEKQLLNGNELINKLGIDKSKKLIGISPFTAYGISKEWPKQRFLELIEKLKSSADVEIILFGSASEKNRLEKLCESTGSKVHIVSEGYSLSDAICIMKRINLFIGNDSGLMHIASALGIPLLGIFGPTLPEKSFPFSKNSEFIYKQIYCSPCLNRVCPTEHECMTSIGVNEVIKKIIKYI